MISFKLNKQMENMDTFKPDRDESDIGVMMMMDALISSGYYVVWGSKHLDRELCSDIVAYRGADMSDCRLLYAYFPRYGQHGKTQGGTELLPSLPGIISL